jgi:hypothetical protein
MIGKIALIAAAAIVAVSASAAGAAPRPGYNAYGSVTPFDTQSNTRTVGRNVAAARTTALRDRNVSSGQLSQYTWGVQQSDLYRVCMDQHGQVE